METLNTTELCFPQLLNASCRKPPQHLAANFFIFIALSLLIGLTVTLNLLVIISKSLIQVLQLLLLCVCRQLHTPTNVLLLSLAVSDFLIGLCVMPIPFFFTEDCWILGTFMCGLYTFTAFILTSVSVGNMVLISADRYVAICDPLRYPTKVTLRRVQVCVCLCWAASFFYNGVTLKDFLKDPDIFNLCIGECVLLLDYITGAVDVVITFFCPITVIVILYIRVFMVAVSQARAMRSHIVSLQSSAQPRVKKSELKAATALGVVVFIFLVCFCPYFYPNIAGLTYKSSDFASVFGNWLFYSNSCINPLIYAFFYPWFRKSLKSIVTLQILQPDSCDANIL
ncbi:trace amine-associated receptor 13c [Oryzias melastigma]|uniref:trace amine-associated receptor 13c n=1 Tax=Oryzias melastigma TaxID=30732 RepID=UPI00168CB9F9|nr:trace amine-associated receptor 13c [Oryzias melastigma]